MAVVEQDTRRTRAMEGTEGGVIAPETLVGDLAAVFREHGLEIKEVTDKKDFERGIHNFGVKVVPAKLSQNAQGELFETDE